MFISFKKNREDHLSKVCILIPIHRPHYGYLNNITKISKITNTNVFIVLSDYDVEVVIKYTELNFINFNDLYAGNITNYITQKKLIGANHVFRQYDFDYVVCLDSEIRLNKKFNNNVLLKVCEEFYLEGKLYGGGKIQDHFLQINLKCMDFNGCNDDLKREYGDIYFWFSEIPIYKKDFFIEFYSEMRIEESSYEFSHFDFLLYSYWLVKHKNFQIVDWNKLSLDGKHQLNYSGEMIDNEEFLTFLECNRIYLHWISEDRAKKINRPYILFRYHLDRKSSIYYRALKLIKKKFGYAN